jgi:hypothetical protein
MVSGRNCLKYFCVFFVLQSSGAQRLFDHSVCVFAPRTHPLCFTFSRVERLVSNYTSSRVLIYARSSLTIPPVTCNSLCPVFIFVRVGMFWFFFSRPLECSPHFDTSRLISGSNLYFLHIWVFLSVCQLVSTSSYKKYVSFIPCTGHVGP